MIISTCQCIGEAKDCCTKFMVERVEKIIDYRSTPLVDDTAQFESLTAPKRQKQVIEIINELPIKNIHAYAKTNNEPTYGFVIGQSGKIIYKGRLRLILISYEDSHRDTRPSVVLENIKMAVSLEHLRSLNWVGKYHKNNIAE